MDRINLLASLVKDANSLVDVGCDHGFVAIKALENNDVKKAYLLDVNEGPLENARKNVIKNDLISRCEFILSDGLSNYTGEEDTLIIAGMGGMLITKILRESFLKAKNFKHIILEANNENDKLRAFLISNFFVFDNEHLIQDGNKCYVIIEGHFDDTVKMGYTLLDMKFGPILRRNQSDLFKEIVEKRRVMLTECLAKATDEVGKSKIRVELAFISLLKESK